MEKRVARDHGVKKEKYFFFHNFRDYGIKCSKEFLGQKIRNAGKPNWIPDFNSANNSSRPRDDMPGHLLRISNFGISSFLAKIIFYGSYSYFLSLLVTDYIRHSLIAYND